MSRRKQRIEKLYFELVQRPVYEWRVLHRCERPDLDEERLTRTNLIAGHFEVGKPATWACGQCGVYCERGAVHSPEGLQSLMLRD